MLKIPAPFPQVGSFALFEDPNLPAGERRAELVRVMRFGAGVTVAFPLRLGASGNRITELSSLIDATPLTREEERELTDLQRSLARQARPNRARIDRAESLRKRLIYSSLLATELKKLERLQAKGQPSTGALLPRHAA